MLNGGAAPIPGPPYGTVRDATTFYSALVPKQKTAVLPKVSVPLVDTVIVVKGKPIRWLHSTASGEATEKLHVDKESIHATFRTAGAYMLNAYCLSVHCLLVVCEARYASTVYS